jgi:hypothetical protein
LAIWSYCQYYDPVKDVVGPVAVGQEFVWRGSEGGEKCGHISVTPGNERTMAVRVRSEFGDERFGVFAADGGVDGKIAGFAERFKGEPGPNAALGVGASVETIDFDRRYLILKRLEVLRVEASALLSLRS